MAGFGAGFGAGFSRSYNLAQDNKARQKRDAFRMFMADFTDRQKTYSARKAEQEKIAKAAETVLSSTGAPPGALPQVYEWVETFGADKALEMAQSASKKNAWKPSEMEPGQVNEKPGVQEEMNKIQEQPAIAATKPQEPTQATPEEAAKFEKSQPTDRTSLKDLIMGKVAGLQNPEATNYQDAKSKAMSQYGVNEKQMAEVLSGQPAPNRPNVPNPVRATITEDDTQWGDPAETVRLGNTMFKEFSVEADKLFKSRNEFKSIVRDAQAMREVVERTNGAVLNEPTHLIAKAITATKYTAGGLTTLLFGADQAEDLMTRGSSDGDIAKTQRDIALQEGVVQQAQAEYDALGVGSVLQNAEQLSTAGRLIDQKAKLMAYKLGVMYQQEGRSFAEAERVMFEAMAKAGNNPTQFVEAMGQLLEGEKLRLDDAYESYNRMYGGMERRYNSLPTSKGYEAEPVNPEFLGGSEEERIYNQFVTGKPTQTGAQAPAIDEGWTVRIKE